MIGPLKSLRGVLSAGMKEIRGGEPARIKKTQAGYAKKFAAANANFDAFILSYPKSGKTWLRLMVGFYLARVTGSPESDALELDMLGERAGLPRIKYAHNATQPIDCLPASTPCVASSDQWRARKVLVLVREPKAVLVSSFHHARFRSQFFGGSLSEFIRDPRFGIDKVATAYRRWHGNRHEASSFSVISYEQMHARPADVLRQTLAFIGAPSPDESIIAEAVNFGRFENMKQYETMDYFKNDRMRNTGLADVSRGSKVREGKTDSFKSHLTGEDIAYIERRLAELGGNPFAAETAVA